MECYFKSDYSLKLFLEWGDLEYRYITAQGNYDINEVDTITATLYGETEFGDNSSDKVYTEYTITLTGQLDNGAGTGSGDFTLKLSNNYLSTPYNNYKGSWTLTKMQ